ncbi:MAG: hypothetical protein P1P87_07525, partial [Trueperaceae bacterium]|nr:hypothetical protein [Trueperaceae bacterium]
DRVRDAVRAAADGVDAGEVLARVAVALAIPEGDLARWHLNHTTLYAHLSALRSAGLLATRVADHRLTWGAP